MSFPDVTGALIDYLTDNNVHAADVHISASIPDDDRDKSVQVRRVGGSAMPPVRDSPIMEFRHWGETARGAAQAAGLTRAALWALPGTDLLGAGVTVYRLDETGYRDVSDPLTGRPLSILTVNIQIRADSAIQAN